MPLVDGGPVPDGECWFRVLLETNRTASGALHHSALKGRGAFNPSPGKPWTHELSGRLVSLAGASDDIVAQAEAFAARSRQNFVDRGKPVPSKCRLAGWICARTTEIARTFANGVEAKVVYTPNADIAHADVAAFNATADDGLEPLRAHLQKSVRVVTKADVAKLLENCGA